MTIKSRVTNILNCGILEKLVIIQKHDYTAKTLR